MMMMNLEALSLFCFNRLRFPFQKKRSRPVDDQKINEPPMKKHKNSKCKKSPLPIVIKDIITHFAEIDYEKIN